MPNAADLVPVVIADHAANGERVLVTESRGSTLHRPLVTLRHEYESDGVPRAVTLDPQQALRAGLALVDFARRHGART